MGAPPLIQLGNLGMADTLILMVLALVVFGPRRLPQIGRQIGKLMYEFRKASNDFKFQMEEELRLQEDADRRKKEEAERAKNLALNPPAQTVESQAAIGAQESVSAPSHPLYGSGYPEQYPAEGAAAAPAEPHMTLPRIQPPPTGLPIPAGGKATSNSAQETEVPGPADQAIEAAQGEATVTRDQATESATVSEEGVLAEANIGAEPPASASESQPGADSSNPPNPDSPRSETVSHHG
jgi:sec-independent protein translocase protein TatB